MADPVIQARNELARLYQRGGNPEPEVAADARAALALAHIDREIRLRTQDVQLDDQRAGHLVGLILMQCGVSGDDVTEIEILTRSAVRRGQARFR